MSAAQWVFLTAFTVLLVILVASAVGIVATAARGRRPAGLRGLLRALELSPSLPAAPTRWAYLLHRISGISIFAFLALHIVDVSLLAFSAPLYDEVHELYSTPVLRAFACALVLAVLFHTCNGLRLILVDVADLGLDASRRALHVVVILTLALGLPASVLIMVPVL